jgi:hypothetical protein
MVRTIYGHYSYTLLQEFTQENTTKQAGKRVQVLSCIDIINDNEYEYLSRKQ